MKHVRFVFVCLVLALPACTPQDNGARLSGYSGAETLPAGGGALNVADAAIGDGDPTMALSVSQSVLRNDPGNVDALIHEGEAYYALMRCPDAMAAYTLALRADPKSSDAETGMGRCLLKTDPKGAEAVLMLAVRDNPQNAPAWNDLGISRDLQGNFAGAVSPLQQALLLEPGSLPAEENLGLSLVLAGNSAEALQYLGPLAAGSDATAKLRENYAAALIASGRDTEARAVLGIDLPPDKVESAMAGFQAMFTATQPALEEGENSLGKFPTEAAPLPPPSSRLALR